MRDLDRFFVPISKRDKECQEFGFSCTLSHNVKLRRLHKRHKEEIEFQQNMNFRAKTKLKRRTFFNRISKSFDLDGHQTLDIYPIQKL